MNKEYWKAILWRAWHAVWETAASTLPATVVITPAMIEHFDTSIIYVVLAWAFTAVFAGVISIIKSLAIGVPENKLADTLYALDNIVDEGYYEEFNALDVEEVDEEE